LDSCEDNLVNFELKIGSLLQWAYRFPFQFGAENVAFINKQEILKLFSDLPPAHQPKKKEEKREKRIIF
jgi:hypothetical protein